MKMKVSDIKKELASFNIPAKDMSGKSKQELEDMLKGWGGVLDDATEQINIDVDKQEQEAECKEGTNLNVRDINPTDFGWTSFVLDWLDASEKFKDKYPKVDGLRRFAEYYYGISSSSTKIIQPPCIGNGGVAVVRHRIYLNNSTYFDGSADASLHNTDFPYSKYLTATAETRAEGRALRRALKLQVVTAEELQYGDDSFAPEIENEEGITSAQITFFTNMAMDSERGNNINISKLAEHLFGDEYTGMTKLSRGQAGVLNQKLSSFQGDTSLIPENVKGYDANWAMELYQQQSEKLNESNLSSNAAFKV